MNAKKISILIISPTLGRVNRGAETFTYEFIEHLSDKFKVTVVLAKKIRFNRCGINQIELGDGVDSSFLDKYTSLIYLIRKSKTIFTKIFNKAITHFYYLLPEVIESFLLTKKFLLIG